MCGRAAAVLVVGAAGVAAAEEAACVAVGVACAVVVAVVSAAAEAAPRLEAGAIAAQEPVDIAGEEAGVIAAVGTAGRARRRCRDHPAFHHH